MSAKIIESEIFVPCSRIFHELHEEPVAAFLDSSLKNKLGKYSIIGSLPYLILRESHGVLYINGQKSAMSLEAYVKEYLKEHKEENPTKLPLVSGAIGFFSYDYGRHFEHIATRHTMQSEMPDVVLAFYDCFYIEDREKQVLYLIANGKQQEADKTIAQMQERVKRIAEKAVEKKKEISDELDLKQIQELAERQITKSDYQNAIRQVVEYIKKGHIYVMNLTQMLTVPSTSAPYEVFCRLRENNPAPFSAYFHDGPLTIVSASPERFLRIRNGKIETRPIKGTIKRGKNPEEDKRLAELLRNSEKDKSELLMIVDLERNDLNRICEPGSVQVTELFELETYATVFHLIANITGTLQKEVDVIDVLKAAFPGGSITGAPKIRAMEIIDELESSRRGIYTGLIGYLSLNGDCDFNIAIRTAVHQDQEYQIGVGGGITYESDEEAEYEEILQKAKALVEAVLS